MTAGGDDSAGGSGGGLLYTAWWRFAAAVHHSCSAGSLLPLLWVHCTLSTTRRRNLSLGAVPNIKGKWDGNHRVGTWNDTLGRAVFLPSIFHCLQISTQNPFDCKRYSDGLSSDCVKHWHWLRHWHACLLWRTLNGRWAWPRTLNWSRSGWNGSSHTWQVVSGHSFTTLYSFLGTFYDQRQLPLALRHVSKNDHTYKWVVPSGY